MSPFLYNCWWAGMHFLAGAFLFLLLREFGLGHFSSFFGGVCFSLGGVVGELGWPHLLESSIWLPVILLFFTKATHASETPKAVLNACYGGLALGMSILAGGLHMVIMQALVLVSAGIFEWLVFNAAVEPASPGWRRPVTVVALILAIGFAAGSIQLFPSIEYSQRSLRWLGAAGAVPATQKIPYEDMQDALLPQGIVGLLISNAFDGNRGIGEVLNPYLGVFPLIAAIVGIRRAWGNPWVRYLTGLAIVALLYSFGRFSWLNGVLYALVPKLWLAREAPRMLYLLDFSLAILAAFGVEELLSKRERALWPMLVKGLSLLVIACAICFLVPAIFGKPQIGPWASLSVVLIFGSYGLLLYLARTTSLTASRILIVGLVLFDLSAFDWTAQGRISTTKAGTNYLNKAMSLEGAATFLKSRPGPFRVEILGGVRPNIGDLFGIPNDQGPGATLPIDFMRISGNRDLLNVRYLLKPASTPDPGPVYEDSAWKIYENPSGLPRAWIVHDAILDQSTMNGLPAFDPARIALVKRPLKVKLVAVPDSAEETVRFDKMGANAIEMRVHARSRGLLVVSETFYPGWYASVNGAPQEIYEVDGDLRAVEIPSGDSRVNMTYAPKSVYAGAAGSLLALILTLCVWLRERRCVSQNLP